MGYTLGTKTAGGTFEEESRRRAGVGPACTDEGTMATHGGVAGHIIKRPRLTRILDETDARIILLCAPAGYGKTTLAREWTATREEPVLWYSGGPAMADVAALAVDLAELLASDASALERVRYVASRGEPPRTLAKAIARGTAAPVSVLVLDDYQFARESPEADELVRELLSMTAHRLVIASRSAPKWATGRSVVYGETLLLARKDLAF